MSFEGNTPICVPTIYSGMKLKSAANSSVVAGFLTAWYAHTATISFHMLQVSMQFGTSTFVTSQ